MMWFLNLRNSEWEQNGVWRKVENCSSFLFVLTGITHVVTPLGSHTSLTPLVTPVTVVSQGSQVAHILATPQQLGGKV